MKTQHNGDGNIYSKLTADSSLKLRTVLTIIAVIASAMAVLFVLHAETDSSSAEVIEGGQCGPDARYYIYSDGTLEINGSGEMYNYDGVRAPWYEYRDDITKIVISDEITKLGLWAFVGMKHVTELTIPITLDSVINNDYSAFAGCYRVEKVNFTCGTDGYGYGYAAYEQNNSWYQLTPWYQSRDVLKEINFADGIKGIGSDAFRELNITSLVLPESVVVLGCHCFYNCTKITDLTIPMSLNSYGNETYPAFQGCMAIENVVFTYGNGIAFDYADWTGSTKNANLAPWNLNSAITKTIFIPESITNVGKWMFCGCNIRELTIPISAVQVSNSGFYGTYDSLEKVTITKGTGVGGDYRNYVSSCLYNPWNLAPNLKTVTVEEGVTYIGSYTFCRCTTETFVLPDTLSALSECTFSHCDIKYLTLPISLNAVWLDKYPAFNETTGLKKVTFTPGSGYGFNYSDSTGSNCWYQLTPWFQCNGSTLMAIEFEGAIKSIGCNAFRELYIKSVTIPDHVESLGAHSFYNCICLSSLSIPVTVDSVGSVQAPAFEGCEYITNLRLTAGINGIGFNYTDYLPIWCSPDNRICQIFVEKGVTHVGDNTFDGFSFYGFDGELLSPLAENLSGHEFNGRNGVMYKWW